MESKKLLFVVAASLVACGGIYGCGEDGGVSTGGNTPAKVVLCGGEYCPASACVEDVCAAGSAVDKAAYCKDQTNCHTDASCKGEGDCDYVCGQTKNSCKWSVCKTASACQTSDQCDYSNSMEDSDGDGLLNGLEAKLGTDPCNADTDGDGVPDGLEDLNHNGIIEEHLGETDPTDASSKPASSEAVLLIQEVCNPEKMTSGGSMESLDNGMLNIAVPKGIGQNRSLTGTRQKNSARYDDPAGVAIFFMAKERPSSPNSILSKLMTTEEGGVLEDAVASSNFTSSVPLTAWYDNGYNRDRSLQFVPDHEVTRYIYNITLTENGTIEAVADAIVKAETKDNILTTGKTTCADNQAVLYLSRSVYLENDKMVVGYSGAIACKDTKASNMQVSALMDDIYSGTHVAPKGLDSARYGFDAYKSFVCQTKDFGESNAKVDFIWVIDNSGSMQDEQENLAKTVDAFVEQLTASGIDYRYGVTSTDAYLLDEWDDKLNEKSQLSVFYDATSEWYQESVGYYGYSGLRNTGVNAGAVNRCMLNNTTVQRQGTSLADLVTKDTDCTKVDDATKELVKGYNICGRGYEDGLKSGLVILERLALDASMAYADIPEDAENVLDLKRKSNWVFSNTGNSAQRNCAEGATSEKIVNNATCATAYDSCALRDDALRYFIWVSDEESRQFKEPIDTKADGTTSLLSDITTELVGCKTGYKLGVTDNNDGDTIDLNQFVFEMARGMWTKQPTQDETACNPSMREKLLNLEASGEDLEEMSLAKLKENLPEYYNMLMYYIQEYKKYEGKGGVAGFALVGDVGKDKGGACQELKNSGDAKEGANYGLSYIHMAKYLSQLTSDGKNDGKGGGYASICSTDYSATVNAIFEDVAGRLSRHGLKGYPISSTIRVAIVQNGVSKELQRGKDWSYDASQNTITFKYKANSTDQIAIAYVVWSPLQG